MQLRQRKETKRYRYGHLIQPWSVKALFLLLGLRCVLYCLPFPRRFHSLEVEPVEGPSLEPVSLCETQSCVETAGLNLKVAGVAGSWEHLLVAATTSSSSVPRRVDERSNPDFKRSQIDGTLENVQKKFGCKYSHRSDSGATSWPQLGQRWLFWLPNPESLVVLKEKVNKATFVPLQFFRQATFTTTTGNQEHLCFLVRPGQKATRPKGSRLESLKTQNSQVLNFKKILKTLCRVEVEELNLLSKVSP